MRAMVAGRLPVMSRPLKRMRPAVGVRKCVRRLKHVVLPAPLGPMSAWIVPRRTRRSTFLTATKPRNSLVRPSVSRMTLTVKEREAGSCRGWAVRGAYRLRVEHRLPLLLPCAVGLARFPRAHAVVLRAHYVLDERARVFVKRRLHQPLDVTVRRRRLVAEPLEQLGQRRVDVAGRAHARHEADGPRGLGGDLVVEQ